MDAGPAVEAVGCRRGCRRGRAGGARRPRAGAREGRLLMSRFSGPQQRGAAHQLAVQRRREAETRQAAERARDAARIAAYEEPAPLSDEEFAEALWAALAVEPARALI